MSNLKSKYAEKIRSLVRDTIEPQFWETVAEAFPEVNLGDLDPMVCVAFGRACEDVIAKWLDANHPDFFPMDIPEGFFESSTGGGCTAFAKKYDDGYSVIVTNDDSQAPQEGESLIWVGLYDAEGGEVECVPCPSASAARDRIAMIERGRKDVPADEKRLALLTLKERPTAAESAAWIIGLVYDLGLSFNPDTSPSKYVRDDGSPFLSARECEALSASLERLRCSRTYEIAGDAIAAKIAGKPRPTPYKDGYGRFMPQCLIDLKFEDQSWHNDEAARSVLHFEGRDLLVSDGEPNDDCKFRFVVTVEAMDGEDCPAMPEVILETNDEAELGAFIRGYQANYFGC